MMRLLTVVLIALLGPAGGAASAQEAYPNRPISLVVPFPPGGVSA